jgi:cold-inducible RNA-binding protein
VLLGPLVASDTAICLAGRGLASVTPRLARGGEARLQHCASPSHLGARPRYKEATLASKSLYVGNLSYSATESSLRTLFAEYEPSEVRLIGDKGFGFVDVPEDKAAAAIAAMNGRDVDGRSITVSEARPRAERSGGGGGRSGGRSGGGYGGGGGGRRW